MTEVNVFQEMRLKQVEFERKKLGFGNVYLVRAENGLYKIGQTTGNVKQRFQLLQGANACTLELVWWRACDGDQRALENALHRLFAKVRHHGEWFTLSESNVRFVLTLGDETVEKLLAARLQDVGR